MKWGNFSHRHHCQKSLHLRWNRWAQKGSSLLPWAHGTWKAHRRLHSSTVFPRCYDSYEALAADPEVIRCPVDINGFEYEIREARRCVKLGRTDSDRYTPQDSLALTRLMYDTRMIWSMKFAGEV